MDKEYTFRTDESEYQYYMSDIGEEAGSFTIRGTVRDFTPETLEELSEYLDEKNAQNGFTNSDPTAFEALQEMDSALYDSVIAAADALADSKTYVQSLEFASSELLEEIWEKIGEIDKFYGDRLTDINWVASSLLEFMNYVSGIFSRPDPISFLENSRSFEVVVDEMTAQIRERQYSAAKDYILKSTEGDVSQELEAAIAGLEAQGYTAAEILAALYSVQNGYDLTVLFYLGGEEYDKLFSVYPAAVSDDMMATLALHGTVLMRFPVYKNGVECYPALEAFVNGLIDIHNANGGLDSTRKKYRDLYLERIYVQSLVLVQADALALALVYAEGGEDQEWLYQHEKWKALTGLWGDVYSIRTEKGVNGRTLFMPDGIRIDGLSFDRNGTYEHDGATKEYCGFAYTVSFYSGSSAPYKTVPVYGNDLSVPGLLTLAQTMEQLDRLGIEMDGQWLKTLDSMAGKLAALNPKAAAAYATVKLFTSLISEEPGSKKLQAASTAVSKFDTNKSLQSALLMADLFVLLMQQGEAMAKLEGDQYKAMQALFNSWAGAGYEARYPGETLGSNVIYGLPININVLAGLHGWQRSETGFRVIYEDAEHDKYAVAMLEAFERAEASWTKDDDISDEKLFILYGCSEQGIGTDVSLSDLDWPRVADLLYGVAKDSGYKSNIDPFEDLRKKYGIKYE